MHDSFHGYKKSQSKFTFVRSGSVCQQLLCGAFGFDKHITLDFLRYFLTGLFFRHVCKIGLSLPSRLLRYSLPQSVGTRQTATQPDKDFQHRSLGFHFMTMLGQRHCYSIGSLINRSTASSRNPLNQPIIRTRSNSFKQTLATHFNESVDESTSRHLHVHNSTNPLLMPP